MPIQAACAALPARAARRTRTLRGIVHWCSHRPSKESMKKSLATRAFRLGQRALLRTTGWDSIAGQWVRAPGALIRLGTRYGGWTIPDRVLGADSICYCVGVGEDISFDLDLVRRYGSTVYAFDPTPRAIAFVDRLAP